MKHLLEYIIVESKLSDSVFCEQFSIMFKNTNINKDTLIKILDNLSSEFIRKLSNYFATEDSSNYIAYEPSDDLFINYETNKEQIINQISDYIVKTKV